MLYNKFKQKTTGVVSETGNFAATSQKHANKVTNLMTATGQAVTLPIATGSGDRYLFRPAVDTAGGSHTIKAPNAAGTFAGTAILFADGGDTTVGFNTVTATDTLTMNGTSLGGLLGASAEFIDVAANKWMVRYVSDASGTEATPFSATVS